MGGRQRQQPHPGGQALARPHAREGHGAHQIAVHPRHRADQQAPAGQRQVHLDRTGLAGRRRQALGPLHQPVHGRPERDQHLLAELSRGEHAAGHLGGGAGGRVGAGQARLEQALPHRPHLQRVERDRQRVADLLRAVPQAHAEPLAQEGADRVAHEGDQAVQLERLRARRRQAAGDEGRSRHALGDHRARAGERGRVEAPRAGGDQRARGEVPRVDGLQRVPHDHPAARRRAVGGPDGAVDGVEQLADRDRRRAFGVGALVAAGVDHDQPVRGGQQGVQQQLAVLAAGVAVADEGVGQRHVVAVAGRDAREDAVVEAQQADHPVRHRAHRHQRADGQVAGAEVGPGGPPAQPVGEQVAHLRSGELGPAGRRAGLVGHLLEQPPELGALPGVALGGEREQVGGAGDRLRPRPDGLRAGEGGERLLQPRHQLRQAAGEVDRPALDVVEREHAAQQPLAVLGHGHAEQHAVQAGAPGVRLEGVEPERGAVVGVEAPAHPGGRDPLLPAGRGRRRRARSGGGRARARPGRASRRR